MGRDEGQCVDGECEGRLIMARILTCGFESRSSLECNQVDLGPQGWSAITYTNTPRVSGGNGVSASFQMNASAGSNERAFKFNAAATEIYARVPIRFAQNLGSTSGHVRQIKFRDSSNNIVLTISHTYSTGNTTVSHSTGAIGTITTSFPFNQWVLMEVHFKLDASSGVVEIKWDGNLVFSYTGNTNPSSRVDILYMSMLMGFTGQNFQTWLDDLAVNDTTGTEQNGWCGDGVIVAALPNGNGDSSDWLGSDGNSTDNYLLVDENPHNSDTDYVSAASTGLKDLYNLAAMPSIPSGSAIVLVQPIAVARRTDPATLSNIDVGIKSGATEDFAASQALTTTYALYAGEIYYVDPDDGMAWDETKVNALQVGIQSS